MSIDNSNITETNQNNGNNNNNDSNGILKGIIMSMKNKPCKQLYRIVLFSLTIYIASILNNSDISNILHTTANGQLVCLNYSSALAL